MGQICILGIIMGKLGKILECLSVSSCPNSSCFCINLENEEEDFEKKPLIPSNKTQLPKLKDLVSGNQTLAFQLKPKVCLFLSEIILFVPQKNNHLI